MTITLALDATFRTPSAALLLDGTILEMANPGSPVEQFPPIIEALLGRAGIGLGGVDELVAGIGPGSFMGVRTAVTMCNTLAFALHKKVSGVLSVDVAAMALPEQGGGWVAISAGRGRWYEGSYVKDGHKLIRNSLPALVDNHHADALTVNDAGDVLPTAADLLKLFDQHGDLTIGFRVESVQPVLPSSFANER